MPAHQESTGGQIIFAPACRIHHTGSVSGRRDYRSIYPSFLRGQSCTFIDKHRRGIAAGRLTHAVGLAAAAGPAPALATTDHSGRRPRAEGKRAGIADVLAMYPRWISLGIALNGTSDTDGTRGTELRRPQPSPSLSGWNALRATCWARRTSVTAPSTVSFAAACLNWTEVLGQDFVARHRKLEEAWNRHTAARSTAYPGGNADSARPRTRSADVVLSSQQFWPALGKTRPAPAGGGT